MTTLTYSSFVRPLSHPAVLAQRSLSLGERFAAWRAARRQAREDRELWALAQTDVRVMKDLACALTRQG